MKARILIFTFLLFACSILTNAQKVKLKEGSVDALKNDTSFNFEFTYENIAVGRFDSEAEYISKKTTAMNEKLAGSGDEWAKKWISNRTEDYEPKFIELFTAFTGSVAAGNANIQLLFTLLQQNPAMMLREVRCLAQVKAPR